MRQKNRLGKRTESGDTAHESFTLPRGPEVTTDPALIEPDSESAQVPQEKPEGHSLSRLAITGGRLQAKLTASVPGDPLEDEAEQMARQVFETGEPPIAMPRESARSAASPSGGEVLGESVSRRIDAVVRSGAAEPLDSGVGRSMSERIGHDFSRVRVHVDESSAESAASIGARAYTVGSSIVFGRGEYAPQTDSGRRLIAHELTHVVQQAQGAPASVQRGIVPGFLRNDKGTKEEIEAAIKSEDPADIKAIDDFSLAEPPQKARLIQIMLNKTNLWAFDRRAVTRIWNSFGDLETLNEDQVALLRTCVDRGYDPKELHGYPFLAGDFRDSVKREVLENLGQNVTTIQKEADRLGLAGDKPKEGEKYNEQMNQLQELAVLIKDAREMLARSRKIVVGYTGALEGLKTGKDEGVLGGKPVTFDPEVQPQLPSATPVTQVNKSRNEMPWAAVYPAYAAFSQTIAAVLAQNPALYALEILAEPMKASGPAKPGQDPSLNYGEQSRLSGFEMMSTQQAREKVGKALLDVYNNGRKTMGNVMGGKMSPLQFDLVVDRHKKGQHGPKWAKPYAKFAAERVVADDKPGFDQAMEMVGIVLLLGAVVIGTGGAATPLMGAILAGANIASAAAAAAYKTFEAQDVQTAAQSGASTNTAVTSQQAADRAALDAQMYQFMAIAAIAAEGFGALMPAVKTGMKLGAADVTEALETMEVGQYALRTGKTPEELAQIVSASAATDPKAKTVFDKIQDFISRIARPFGSRGALVTDATNLADAEARAHLVEKLIAEDGIEATLKKLGKTPDELLKMVGEQSAISGRLKTFMAMPELLTKLTPEELGEKLALLAGEARKDPKAAGAMLQLGVERLGPLKALRKAGGWDAITKALGHEGAAMQGLVTWRDLALEDLYQNLTRLGGAGDMKDAQQFLSRRLGCTVEELGIGGAKPLIGGTGAKDIEAILLRVSDDRELANKGLLATGPLKKMAEEGLALQEQWKTMTPKQRGDKLLEMANARLREVGVPELEDVKNIANDAGNFDRKTWTMGLQKSLLEKDDNFKWLLEATYHEARHAEQAYQIARLKATEMSSEVMAKSVAEGGLNIHPKIAAAAHRAPTLQAASAEGRQALRWYESMIGAGRQTRGEILTEWKTAEREWEAQKAFMQREREARPELAAMLAPNEERAWVNYAAATKKYFGLVEEADAYMVQSKFAQAFKEHEALKAAMEGRAATPLTGPFSGALNAAADNGPPTVRQGANK